MGAPLNVDLDAAIDREPDPVWIDERVSVAPRGHEVPTPARDLARGIQAIERWLGWALPFQVLVIPVYVDEAPESARFLGALDRDRSPPRFVVPMVLRQSRRGPEDLDCPRLDGILHELVEASLIHPGEHVGTLPDFRVRIGPVEITQRRGTRWFRDGLSDYLSLMALEGLPRDEDVDRLGDCAQVRHSTSRPLSALAGLGREIFDWDQFDSDEGVHERYAAALGLFLVMEDRFGPSGLQEAIRSLASAGFRDGEALREGLEEALGIPLAELAESVHLTDWGMEVEWACHGGGVLVESVDGGSVADRAGLQGGDRLLRLGDRAVQDLVAYERLRLEWAERDALDAWVVARDGDRVERLTPLPAP